MTTNQSEEAEEHAGIGAASCRWLRRQPTPDRKADQRDNNAGRSKDCSPAEDVADKATGSARQQDPAQQAGGNDTDGSSAFLRACQVRGEGNEVLSNATEQAQSEA